MGRICRKIIGFVAGSAAGMFAFYGFLIIMSNAGAKIRPDGLPLDPAWLIIMQFVIALILAFVAIAIYPQKIRKNRYRDNYQSKLSAPLERVL